MRLLITTLFVLSLACLLAAPVCFAQDEPINVSVSSGSIVGKTMEEKKRLYRVDGESWKEYLQNLDLSGTENRLRFTVQRPLSSEGTVAQIFISDLNTGATIWSHILERNTRSIWTNTLYTKRVRVTVRTSIEQNELQILIDAKASVTVPTTPQDLVGTGYTAITAATLPVKAVARAVARLRIEPDGMVASRYCTGFLVSSDLLMTNRHCVATGTEAGSVEVQFGVDTSQAPPSAITRVKDIVLASCDLDFVILRLTDRMCATPTCNAVTDYPPLQLAGLSSPLASTSKLTVIQHPGAFSPKVAAVDCDTGSLIRMGNSSTKTDFGHKCNTEQGSSGSPVFIAGADGTMAVAGLHHWGRRKDLPTATPIIQENLAVNIVDLISFIKKNNPSLATELGLP